MYPNHLKVNPERALIVLILIPKLLNLKPHLNLSIQDHCDRKLVPRSHPIEIVKCIVQKFKLKAPNIINTF